MEGGRAELRGEVLAVCDRSEGVRVIPVRFQVFGSWVRRIKQRCRVVRPAALLARSNRPSPSGRNFSVTEPNERSTSSGNSAVDIDQFTESECQNDFHAAATPNLK